MTEPQSGRLAGVVCLVTALVASALAPVVRADPPGRMSAEAGVHFSVPDGCEIRSTELRGWDGPVKLVVFELEDTSAFVALQVHDYEIAPSSAIERTVSELSLTLSNSRALTIEDAQLRLAGASRRAVRLSFEIGGVPSEATVGAFRDADHTVVALVQGQPDELATSADVFEQILDSVGVGPPPASRAPRGSGLGTGQGL